MDAPRFRAERTVISTGLTLALVTSAVVPILGGPDVAARKRTDSTV